MDSFNKWFSDLLNINTSRGEYGLSFPLGSSCFRDVLRDKDVKIALKKAWFKYVVEETKEIKWKEKYKALEKEVERMKMSKSWVGEF